MAKNNQKAGGSIRIDENVTGAIAYLAACRAKGVCTDTENNGLIRDRILKGGLLKGIKISSVKDGLDIDIDITVKRDTPAILTAKSVQALIKKDIENMTGMRVAAVNVTVSSISI